MRTGMMRCSTTVGLLCVVLAAACGGAEGSSAGAGGSDGASSAVKQACDDLVDAFVDAMSACRTACTDDAATCQKTWGDASANKPALEASLHCVDAVAIRDETALRKTCIPSISTMSCADFTAGILDPSCNDQVLRPQ